MSQEDQDQPRSRIKEKIEQAKQHVKDNRTTYLVGASCLVGGYLLRGSTCPTIVQTIDGNGNIVAAINKSKNVAIAIEYVKARNYVANPVRCIETGEKWASQIEAAVAKHIAPIVLSKHLNNKLETANGLHFERI